MAVTAQQVQDFVDQTMRPFAEHLSAQAGVLAELRTHAAQVAASIASIRGAASSPAVRSWVDTQRTAPLSLAQLLALASLADALSTVPTLDGDLLARGACVRKGG